MFKGLKKYKLDLDLYNPGDLANVNIHKIIKEVIDAESIGFQILITSLYSKKRLDKITKYDPIILCENEEGNLVLIKGVIYYYEAIHNGAKVYVHKVKLKEEEASLIAFEEAIIKLIITQSILGESMGVDRKRKKNKKLTSTSGLKKYVSIFLTEIFTNSSTINGHLDAGKLAAASRIASVLHVSPETISQWLQDIGVRRRRSQRRPRPLSGPNRRLF